MDIFIRIAKGEFEYPDWHNKEEYKKLVKDKDHDGELWDEGLWFPNEKWYQEVEEVKKRFVKALEEEFFGLTGIQNGPSQDIIDKIPGLIRDINISNQSMFAERYGELANIIKSAYDEGLYNKE